MTALDIIDKSVNAYFAYLPRKKPNPRATAQACLIAHRGVHGQDSVCLENTHAAFAQALALGCFGIELDVHVTADNVVVVNHDATLNRLWHKNVAINAISFNELRQLAPEVPSLAEVVEQYGQRLHLFIELKAPFNGMHTLATTLQSLVPGQDYHLLSLDETIFSNLTLFPRQILLLVAGHNNTAHLCRHSLHMNYGGVLGHYCLLTNTLIKQLNAVQQKVGVGFVDSRYSLYRELNRGLKWLFSNNVVHVSHYLHDLQRTPG